MQLLLMLLFCVPFHSCCCCCSRRGGVGVQGMGGVEERGEEEGLL